LERYTEALEMWKVGIEGGVPGTVCFEGRCRCEKLLGIRVKAVQTQSSVSSRTVNDKSSAAVQNLAKYHATESAEDLEKASLYDAIDQKLQTWYTGKETNLRALLSSLDTVLWPESGWTKVSMAELVLPNKVKMVYMRALGKVHPDKISRGATVRVRMLAAGVCAKLNEAWAVFQEQN
jgi:hypothetical protein